MVRVVLIFAIPVLIAINCQPVVPPEEGKDELLVFYQVFVRSFYDSDGDGIGDIKGLISKLDYIESLGANAIWLLPVHPAPSYHKYDVTDYFGIDPVYGSMEDFKSLVKSLHEKRMTIVMDMVFNHSSEDHPWFREALKGPENPYRDYYVWKHPDSIKQNLHNWHIRPEEERVTDESGEKYFGFFWKGMPDLNFDNPRVREEVKSISRFWLNEIGVDGFRLDAALHIYPFYPDREFERSVQWWQEYHAAVEEMRANKEGADNVFLVGEVWEGDTITAHFLEGGMDAAFNFELGFRITETLIAERDSFDLIGELIRTRQLYRSKDPDFKDAIYLTNHDQNRILSELDGNTAQGKLAVSILMTLPGIPFIYYGEEIGMLGIKPDEQIREPMVWGLPGTDKGQTTWEPLMYNSKNEGVKAQLEDSGSLLRHYQSMIKKRKSDPALHSGTLEKFPVEIPDKRLLAYLRQFDNKRTRILHNLSGDTIMVNIPQFDNINELGPYQSLVFTE